eukprot:COSAG06_NODE_155_length_21876_cov_22.287643_18_plen_348_part_00
MRWGRGARTWRTLHSSFSPAAAAAAVSAATGDGRAPPVRLVVMNPDELLLGRGLKGAWQESSNATYERAWRTANQLALVAVDTGDGSSTLFEGVSDEGLIDAADEVLQRMRGETFRSHDETAKRDAAHSQRSATKLQVGGVVSVKADRINSILQTTPHPPSAFGPIETVESAPGQLQGLVEALHDNGNVDVLLRGESWTLGDLEDSPYFCRLVSEFEGGFVVNLHPARVTAYAQHQPVVSRTFLATLHYSLALVWPEPVQLADIQLRCCGDGNNDMLTEQQMGNPKVRSHVYHEDAIFDVHFDKHMQRMTLRDILEGDVEVIVRSSAGLSRHVLLRLYEAFEGNAYG